MTDTGYGLMLNDGQWNGNGCGCIGIDKKTVNVNECIMSGIQHASLWTYNCNKETDECLGSACIHDLAGLGCTHSLWTCLLHAIIVIVHRFPI